MKNNKGYTLVELLVSITVFAIAMVSIIAIMRNTLGAYSDANLDVTVQEDAQIVANQIEEMLCDSKSISKSGDIYVCTSVERGKMVGGAFPENTVEYDFQLVGTDLNLTIKDPATSSSKTTVLAKNVKAFSIDSYDGETVVTGGSLANAKLYNEATFNIDFDTNGKTYSLSRNVYFRNHNENGTFNSITYLKDKTGGGSTVSKDEKLLNVKRFASYNLTANAEFNIKYFAKNPTDGSNIYFYKKTGESTYVADNTASGFFDISVVDNFPHKSDADYTTAKTYILKANSVVEGNFGSALCGNDYYLVGYRDKDLKEKVAIALQVDPVAAEYSVVQVHGSGSVNGEPLLSPVTIKGIDINGAIEDGKDVKCSLELGGKSFPDTVTLKKYDGEIKWKDKDHYPTEYNSCGQWSNGQMNLGVFVDPFNGGIFIGIDNQGAQYGGVKDKINNSDKLKVTLTVGGTAVTVPDLGFDILGSGL